MMNQDFSKTVHELKLASRVRRPAPPLRRSRSLAAFDARDRVEQELTPALDQLMQEVPELLRRRRMYDGKWVVGLTAALPRSGRRPTTACTRLDFGIQILASGTRASLSCAATVADIEIELTKPSVEVALDTDGRRTLRATCEAACLEFARGYFEQTARSR